MPPMNPHYFLTNGYHHHHRKPPPPPPSESPLTPYDKTLRAEVIYLHSLWHLGPPPQYRTRHNYHPQITLQNNSIHTPPSSHYRHQGGCLSSRALYAVRNTRPFKKQKTREKGPMTAHEAEPDPGTDWPVLAPAPESEGWPVLKDMKRPARPVPEEVQALMSEKGMQQQAVECCRKYFYGELLSGPGPKPKNEEDEEEEDGEYLSDEDEEEEEEEEEGRDFKFLLNLFVDSQELREYYKKKQETGAFYCLVCGGIGVKVWKSFKGCLSLVQHCNGIGKTKRRRAHRALAHVVCKVLAWDFHRLPTVVLKGEPLGWSLATSGQDQAGEDAKNVNCSSGRTKSEGASDKFSSDEASDDSGKTGEIVALAMGVEDHGDPRNRLDAAGECSEPVNHEKYSMEDHGEKVTEGVHSQLLSSGSCKEGDLDCVATLKVDNDVGAGVVEQVIQGKAPPSMA